MKSNLRLSTKPLKSNSNPKLQDFRSRIIVRRISSKTHRKEWNQGHCDRKKEIWCLEERKMRMEYVQRERVIQKSFELKTRRTGRFWFVYFFFRLVAYRFFCIFFFFFSHFPSVTFFFNFLAVLGFNRQVIYAGFLYSSFILLLFFKKKILIYLKT